MAERLSLSDIVMPIPGSDHDAALALVVAAPFRATSIAPNQTHSPAAFLHRIGEVVKTLEKGGDPFASVPDYANYVPNKSLLLLQNKNPLFYRMLIMRIHMILPHLGDMLDLPEHYLNEVAAALYMKVILEVPTD